MRTIGGRPPRGPGDWRVMCDYCGIYWPRDRMHLDAANYLACPDEGSGKDAVTLSRLNAGYAQGARPVKARIKRR